MNPPISTESLEEGAVGCLLHMSAPEAREALTLLDIRADLTNPRTQAIAAAVGRAVDADVQPTPVVILGELQRAGEIPSWSTGSPAGVYLAELYGDAPPPAQFHWLVGYLRDGALRRRIAQLSQRLGQAAGTVAVDALLELVDSEINAVRQLAAKATLTSPDRTKATE